MTLLQGALRLAFDLNVSLPPFRRTTTSSSAVPCRAPRPFNLRTIITRPSRVLSVRSCRAITIIDRKEVV